MVEKGPGNEDFRWGDIKIRTVMTADELLDVAFRRASKIAVTDRIKLRQEKNKTSQKIQSISTTLRARLNQTVKEFPSIDRLPPFYFELVDTTVGVDRLKKSLGALTWAAKAIGDVSKDASKKIGPSKSIGVILDSQKHFYGRVASVVHQIGKHLVFLQEARDTLRAIPSVDLDLPCIVVAGFPNVGKSMLVAAISTGKPKVAPYPFTTQQIAIGHIELKYDRVLVMDTPGILDRDPSMRNDIEKRAAAALSHVADCIVFVLDPSEHCGYELSAQMNLLKSIQDLLPDIPTVIVEAKSDILKTDTDRIKLSAETGEGVDEFTEAVLKKLGKRPTF